MPESKVLSNENLKSVMDSVILSAIHDFGAQISRKILKEHPELTTDEQAEVLLGIFIEMTNFLKKNNINEDIEYFQHWNKLFQTTGSC